MTTPAKPPGQLAFDLASRPALGRSDFLVAPCNAAAVALIDRWPDWPGTTLVLHGPPGAGKTHLAEVWRRRTGASRLEAGALSAAQAARFADEGVAQTIVEDVAPGVDETALLHLLNVAAERGGHVLLTASTPAAAWRLGLADLVSRTRAAPSVALAMPDDRLLGALLIKLFAEREITPPSAVVAYLVPRIERSFAAAHAAVATLNRAAFAERRPITVPFARTVLGLTGDESPKAAKVTDA